MNQYGLDVGDLKAAIHVQLIRGFMEHLADPQMSYMSKTSNNVDIVDIGDIGFDIEKQNKSFYLSFKDIILQISSVSFESISSISPISISISTIREIL